MKKYFSIPLVIILFTVACGPKINQEQQEDLNDLSLKVDSSVELLTQVDSANLMQMGNEFFKMKDYLTEEMNDTIKRETVFYLDSFISLKKPMGYITSKYATLKVEALTMQQQLRDLSQDVENRLVDEEHFEKYYNLEKENYIQLADAVSQYEKAYIVSMRRYNSMKTKVDSIITASKTKE